MIKTKRIEQSRYQFLKTSGYTADSIFDEGQHEDLKKKLLDIGGEAVILPAQEVFKQSIMTRATAKVNPKILMMEGEICSCHSNSAEIWDANRDLYSICTGYALSEDGVWRQHSWVVFSDESALIETTVERIVYFGAKLNLMEAEMFLYLIGYSCSPPKMPFVLCVQVIFYQILRKIRNQWAKWRSTKFFTNPRP